MMIKVFETNKDGKIEFTKSELEGLLNEVYEEGCRNSYIYTWTSPSTIPTIDGTKITCDVATSGYINTDITGKSSDYNPTITKSSLN